MDPPHIELKKYKIIWDIQGAITVPRIVLIKTT